MNNAKEYLQQIRMLDKRIKYIEEEIETLRTEQISLNAIRLDGMPHSRVPGDPTGSKAIELADNLAAMETNLMKTRSAYWSKRNEIIEVIGKVTDPELNELLYLRYVKLLPFEGIAYNMSYSYRHTLRLHGKALLEVSAVLDELPLHVTLDV